MSVVLIGAPAAGKTRLGKRLAPRLGLELIDTDRLIVAEHGPIVEIFQRHGEPHFRAIERATVAEALTRDAVVSLGGGAVLDADTQRDLAGASVILLTVTAEAVKARIGNGKRPLVTSMEVWQSLVDKRTPLYTSLADFTIDTSTRPLDDIADDIARWVKENS
ncbi:shikimate kinase [Leifsonia sp. Root112D2]|uniref:shikimate kinase n=1 Tax=Leifsonia sp. Root112D2 TaxID=1736426 RepID=UPI0006F78CF0|nr:shikimate kinase [Leifsonia sp. Root112D2]KQV08042.1 shikimate kinase [Leifsonia sp. Root112D2]